MSSLHPFVQATFGGLLIGLATWLLLASIGKIAGISGIAAGAAFGPIVNNAASSPARFERAWRLFFLLGMICAGFVANQILQPDLVLVQVSPSVAITLTAGLLVGFGTVIGAGCTSGHGICGIGRRSLRSLIATLTFVGAGMITTTLVHL
jgi:uncharacterized protein